MKNIALIVVLITAAVIGVLYRSIKGVYISYFIIVIVHLWNDRFNCHEIKKLGKHFGKCRKR